MKVFQYWNIYRVNINMALSKIAHSIALFWVEFSDFLFFSLPLWHLSPQKWVCKEYITNPISFYRKWIFLILHCLLCTEYLFAFLVPKLKLNLQLSWYWSQDHGEVIRSCKWSSHEWEQCPIKGTTQSSLLSSTAWEYSVKLWTMELILTKGGIWRCLYEELVKTPGINQRISVAE